MTDGAQVFLFALLTSLATGLGVLPLVFARHPTRRWLGVSNALAAGLMLAASFGLVYEGVVHGLWKTLLGVLLGLAFIVFTRSVGWGSGSPGEPWSGWCSPSSFQTP